MTSLLALGSEAASRAMDVVFVHGVEGDAVTTWRRKADESTFWPSWLAEDFPSCGVWSLGYEASSTAWRGSSSPLIDQASEAIPVLRLQGIGDRPLVFVAHSLGGLLIKQMLRHASSYGDPYWQPLHEATLGFVFLATPHAGANLATWSRHLGRVFRTSVSVAELESHSAQLRDLNLWFRSYVQRNEIPLQVFYEKLSTHGITIVDATSADPGITGITPIGIDADHASIAKPADRSALVYRMTRQFVETRLALGRAREGSAPSVAGVSTHTANAAAVPEQELPIGGFLGSLPSGPLVGREAELARVAAVIDEVQQGSGRFVLLGGEPGVGKTRLAQEVTAHLKRARFLLAAGSCYEGRGTTAYYPFLDLLSTLYGLAPPHLREQADQLFPYLGKLLPLQHPTVPREIELQDDRERLYWSVTGFVRALAEIAPLAMLLDDLQWSDRASLELVQHLALHTRSNRVLILATYRDTEVRKPHPLHTAMQNLDRQELLERIAVRRLSEIDTAALIGAVLARDTVAPDLVDLLHERTGGNPFFLTQVIRVLMERGDLSGEGRLHLENFEVPESIRSIVGQRVARLSESAQTVLREASVLGQRFRFDDLLAMGDLSEDQLETCLEQAEGVGLVATQNGDDFSFDHALTHQALYAELPSRRRRRLHAAAGEALERLSGQESQRQAARISNHFLLAEQAERAIPYLLLAGNEAEGVFAHADAELHFRTALELVAGQGRLPVEAEILEKLGRVLHRTARYEEALEALERAAALYQEVGDVDGEARVTYEAADLHFHRGSTEQGMVRVRAMMERLEQLQPPEQPSGAAAEIYSALALAYIWPAARYSEVLETASRAALLAARADYTRGLALAETLRGMALSMIGPISEAQLALEKAVELWLPTGDTWTINAIGYMGRAALDTGDLDRGRAHLERARSVSESVHDPVERIWVESNLGESWYLAGNWIQARIEYEGAVARARKAGSARYLAYALLHLAELSAAEGRWEEAKRAIEEGLAEAERCGALSSQHRGHRLLAEHELAEGQAAAALERLRPFLEMFGPEESRSFPPPVLAEVYVELGQLARAEELVIRRVERLRGEGRKRIVVLWHLAQGIVFAHQNRTAEAETALEVAAAQARAMPYPLAEGRILLARGRLHLCRGEEDQGRRRLEEARAVFEQLGAHAYAEQAATALRSL